MSLVLNATSAARPGDGSATIDPAEMAAFAFLARYSGATFENYKHHLAVWFSWCRNNGLEPLEVERPHIELWLRDMELNGYVRVSKSEGERRYHYKPATLDQRMAAIAGFYKFAAIDARIPKDPAAYVRRPKVHDEERPFVDQNDVRRFIAAADEAGGDRQVLAMLLALNGLRVSEACSIDVEEFGMEKGHRTVRIKRKGGKVVTLPLPVPTVRAIDRLVGTRSSGPLLRRQDGNRLDRRTAYGWVKALAKRAGIAAHFHPHLLRAAFISEALAAGIPLADVQHDASHADPRTTMRYDRRRRNLDRHSTYIVSARLAGG